MKKKFPVLLPLFFCCLLHAQQKGKINHKPTTVTVYTTADKSGLRITENGKFGFKPYAQPFEYEPTIFVDPANSFQSFLGIGGALTDASAETFAKLPASQQKNY